MTVEAYVLLISGRVQGVGFRWFARAQARARNVKGHTRNLADGRVEVVAQGDKEMLEEYIQTLSQGPEGARVDEIEKNATPVDPDPSPSFDIRF